MLLANIKQVKQTPWTDCQTLCTQQVLVLVFYAICCAAVLFSPSEAAEHADEKSESFLITSLIVNRVNIFTQDQAEQSAVYKTVNTLHKTTREATILRELDLEPGQRVTTAQIAEFERILRRTDLFASVSVTVEPDSNSTGAESFAIRINTRDRISIVAGASGSFLGGVGELGFTLGERNVAGLGDSVLLSYTGNTENELRGALSYSDLHFINRDQRALYQIGRTEEGDFYRVRFQRPFRNLQDKVAWSVLAESVERDIDFYEQGVSVVQIPETRRAVDLSGVWRTGNADLSFRRGLVFQFSDQVYEESRGVQADTIDPPEDSTEVFAGVLVARDKINEFRKVSGIDTLKFTQDISLGSVAELQLGFIHTNFNNSSSDSLLTPTLNGRVATSLASGDNTLLSFSLSGAATLADIGDAVAPLADNRTWSVSASGKWFNTSFDSHTLAARLDYTFAQSDLDLPVQFTLGENNGLRGYDRRFLSGRERLRLNIEDRMDFDWRLGVFDVGLLGFFDAGWVADDDGTDSLRRSAGVGLRLGSGVLLGAGVIRIDVAVPFDDDSGSHDPLLSIAVGQVFSF